MKLSDVTLYLDVDGVINTNQNKSFTDLKLGFATPLDEPDESYKMRWSPTIISFLMSLGIRIVYLSSWKASGPAVLDPLFGLKSDGFLDWDKIPNTYFDFGKLVALKADQEAHPSPFIWIDDIATRNFKNKEWTEAGRNDFLVIQTSDRYGLNSKQLDKMADFVAAHS